MSDNDPINDGNSPTPTGAPMWRQNLPSTRRAASADSQSSVPADFLTGRLTWFFIILSCLLLLRFFVPYFAEQIEYSRTRGRQRAEVNVARTALQELPLDQLSKAYQLVSKRIGPSVVSVNVASVQELPPDEFAWLFGPQRQESQGQGSGVIVDETGYVVTNNHVVRGATKIEVALADGRVVPGRVVGTDPLTDLAVLKIDAANLIAAEWGDSDELEEGAMVWAIGSPFGLNRTITFGILSAKNRAGLSNSPHLDFLQTDAAVNPGNSGGPLVDAQGRVVGINTAILGEVYQGVSFAIPSTIARSVYDRLKAGGRVERGWLGVSLLDLNAGLARELQTTLTEGAVVEALARVDGAASPAQQAGMQPGDVIVSWNGAKIPNSATLSRLVARTLIGSTADVVIVRRGQKLTLQVKIDARPLRLN